MNTNGSNLDFFDERGIQVDISRLIQLELVVTNYDISKKSIRYRMTNIESYPSLNLFARFKIRNASSLLARPTESSRLLQTSSDQYLKPIVLPSAAFTSFDADTLCLCIYIIVCFSS